MSPGAGRRTGSRSMIAATSGCRRAAAAAASTQASASRPYLRARGWRRTAAAAFARAPSAFLRTALSLFFWSGPALSSRQAIRNRRRPFGPPRRAPRPPRPPLSRPGRDLEDVGFLEEPSGRAGWRPRGRLVTFRAPGPGPRDPLADLHRDLPLLEHPEEEADERGHHETPEVVGAQVRVRSRDRAFEILAPGALGDVRVRVDGLLERQNLVGRNVFVKNPFGVRDNVGQEAVERRVGFDVRAAIWGGPARHPRELPAVDVCGL